MNHDDDLLTAAAAIERREMKREREKTPRQTVIPKATFAVKLESAAWDAGLATATASFDATTRVLREKGLLP